MTNKTLGILGALALLAVILAVVATRGQPRLEAADQAGQVLFPKLVNDIDKLRSLVIKHGGETMTIDWDDKAKIFRMRERGGYPVDVEKVQAVAVRLARLTKLEAKTKMADRYDRLDLGDPNVKGGQATELTLLDAGGKAFADLIVGKRKFTLGGREGGTYVRFPNDPQTWLALGELTVGSAAHDWLKPEIADIKDTAIKRVTVTHANGEKIVVAKGPNGFILENMPKGMEMVTPSTAEDYAKLLDTLKLDDVAEASKVTFPKDKTTTAVFEGVDGFQITLDNFDADGKYWVRLKTTPPATKDGAADKPEAAKQIADLAARTDGWVYQVPQYAIVALTKSMSDITKKPDPKAAQQSAPQGMPGGMPAGLQGFGAPPRP
ncbi:MAG: DUF4340 domain-containing protein [Rhodospirillaceae bacterium]|nr:DUF4340 domain-containing protein [Rhodospirillaceae bacterium]